ncbi:mitogen-activated protein kinase kinase kinase 10-like [Achroia grisella]|uniref:mitogen-activated protein kinase kinase kinase 10-like n=1 Tax=Achroia grisella TaxID=688607 RepID=UPI0027D3280E|nr:mitogen-activated protein kinase kinase kinase 10-like [Achroia grisella]
MTDSVTLADADTVRSAARSRPVSRARSRTSRPSSASSTRSTRSTRSMLVEDDLSGCLVSSEDGLAKAAVPKRPHVDGPGPSGAAGKPSKIPCPSSGNGVVLVVPVGRATESPATSPKSRRQEKRGDDGVFVRPSEVPAGKGKVPQKDDSQPVAVFRAEAQRKLGAALDTVHRCGNLKGTDQKQLKESISSVMLMAEELDGSAAINSEFTAGAVKRRMLEAQVEELRKENKELRSQLQALQAQMRQLAANSGSQPPLAASRAPQGSPRVRAPGPTPEPDEVGAFRADIMRATGELIDARIGAQIEKGIREIKAALGISSPASTIRPEYRPPLQSDGRYEVLARIPGAGGPGFRDAPHLRGAQGADFPPLGGQPASRQTSGSQQPGPSGAGRAQDGWNTVVRRGGKNRSVPERQTQSTQSTQRSSGAPSQGKKGKPAPPSPSKLRAPRSAAVVVSLCPEAEAAGMTYSKVLKEAKEKIDLASLGLGSLRFKTAATGARILEIPGSQTGDQADALASKFRDVFPEGTGRVARPTKTAEMRLMGLDDGTDREEVAAAVVGAWDRMGSTKGCRPPKQAARVEEMEAEPGPSPPTTGLAAVDAGASAVT